MRIQLPDSLEERLSEAAYQQKLTVPELIRRACERSLEPPAPAPEATEAEAPQAPRLPDAVDMGEVMKPESEWRELAREYIRAAQERNARLEARWSR